MAPSLNPYVAASGGIPVCVAQAALPVPPNPTSLGDVSNWNGTDIVIPEFDMIVWADATDNLTAAKLWAAIPHAITLAGQAITSVAGNVLTKIGHGYLSGDGPVQLTGSLPTGTLPLTNYWIFVIDANTFSLATTQINALKDQIITLSSTSAPTITGSGSAGASTRVHWHETVDKFGNQLGRAHDGAIALTNQLGWTQHFTHSPLNIAYSLSATLSAATVSATLIPIRDR